MENSPLELYETAYRLHYTENRVSDALKYYAALLREFPESNECGYAVIQIQKIRSNDIAKSITATKSKSGPLALIAFILSLVTIVAISAGASFLYSKNITAQKKTELAVRALGMALNDDYKEALELLSDMKNMSKKDDITPYELSAHIHRKAGDIPKARAEYDLFYRLNPDKKGKPAEELVPDLPSEKNEKKRGR
jgi:tetratricopeptide (TPR) repeat protein